MSDTAKTDDPTPDTPWRQLIEGDDHMWARGNNVWGAVVANPNTDLAKPCWLVRAWHPYDVSDHKTLRTTTATLEEGKAWADKRLEKHPYQPAAQHAGRRRP